MSNGQTAVTCPVCGIEFIPKCSHQKCCTRAHGRYLKNKNRKRPPNRECPVCGQPFHASSKDHYTCSYECRAKRFETIALRGQSTPWASPVMFEKWASPIFRCRDCGADITHAKKSHRTDGRCASCFNTRAMVRVFETGRRNPISRCSACGNEFDRRDRPKFTRTCSEECAREQVKQRNDDHRHRARKHGVTYEPVNVRRVFERDGYRCHICGRKTDRKAYESRTWNNYVPNHRYPTLDHVVPLSKGGGHTYANTACACWKCNCIDKGDGVTAHGEQWLV